MELYTLYKIKKYSLIDQECKQIMKVMWITTSITWRVSTAAFSLQALCTSEVK